MLCGLATEMFKAINNRTLVTWKIFQNATQNSSTWCIVSYHESAHNGYKSLKAFGLKIWNQLQPNIKAETCFAKLKEYRITRRGPNCKCNVCKMVWYVFR